MATDSNATDNESNLICLNCSPDWLFKIRPEHLLLKNSFRRLRLLKNLNSFILIEVSSQNFGVSCMCGNALLHGLAVNTAITPLGGPFHTTALAIPNHRKLLFLLGTLHRLPCHGGLDTK